ncbi:hypothetical protein E1B28_001068 [Marasmius oreades]|uniref:Peroxin domain-containing protein n=1 Tax=Marasmius oreades TaxID=181124 RepID=A0A9P7V2M4_9AGAR|nr:uncharacterized protein E1B28_001068 [Marasmius oreades]KAG7099201.1 hypothetical protein E1B28_001068 [Marasmius oreades]
MEAEDHGRPEATSADSASWDQLDFSDLDESLDIGLSESQLREEYDNEEIERFLSLFAANVTEVHIPLPRGTWSSTPDVNSEMKGASRSFSEELAARYLLPYLPPSPPHPPPFTLGRLRLATQRLHLSTIPVYIPFLHRLFKLAIWEEKQTSGFYCLIYWVLWYYDLLLPTLILRILYNLVRRRIFPYPTATELRERQIEIERAKELGDEVSARLTSSSSDISEMWRLFRLITKSVKSDVRNHEKVKDKYKNGKEKGKGKGKETASSDRSDVEIDISTVLDNPMENQQERDLKRSILQCASSIADFHERIHNLFIWRRTKASFHYGVLMVICFFLTLLLPTRYISKLVYLVAGILFWHIVPVIAALPYEDRARLPPPLADVPTDADYAMELISQRINTGLDVKPQHKRHKKESKVNDTKITSRSLSGPVGASNTDKSINWKKWGERAAIGKAWAVDNKLIGGNKEWPQTSNAPQAPLVPSAATAVGQLLSPVESHAFPCQHSNGPGLITLSPAIFYFTPLMAPHPTVAFPLTYLKVVKKSGLFKGLTLKWTDTQDGENEHEEIFKWVGGRDELFARLVGSDVGKWRRA